MAATDSPRSWSVGENDYGGLVIFHIHPDGEAPAYVIDRSRNGVLAQCSDCVEYLEMRGTAGAPDAIEAPERAG